jgi:tight adherence protein C
MDIDRSSLFLVGSIGLATAGVALLAIGIRLERSAVRRRIDLVSRVADPGASGIREGATRNPSLIRPDAGIGLGQQREASRRLSSMGLPMRFEAAASFAIHMISAVFGGLGGLLLLRFIPLRGGSVMQLLGALALAVLGWFIPVVFLNRLVRRHAAAAARGLPDALELLVVCVEAGLSLEDGIDRIIGELRISQPALAAELALTSADLKILPSRDQALANLAERVDVPSVRSVVSTLIQTLRYGTPWAHALREVAAEMRTAALIDLEERANRLPAIMTVPMMIFIMPVIFLIVGGPAALRLIDVMGRR